jgi:uncharacterized membrane protein (UPF0127 family)
MQKILIYNLSRPEVKPLRAGYCVSFWCRLRGLTLRSQLPEDEGLLLVESKDSRMDASIHMLMVFMDLGVVWINNDCQVVDLVLAKSWRPAYFPKLPARYVLEINPQRLKDFEVGDRLRFGEANPG